MQRNINFPLSYRLKSLVEIAPDMAVDIPRFYQYLGEILSPMIADPSVLSLTNLKILLEPLVNMGKAGVIMAEALNMAASKTSVIIKLLNVSTLIEIEIKFLCFFIIIF